MARSPDPADRGGNRLESRLRLAGWIAAAALAGGTLGGCAGASKSSGTGEPSVEAIEREERAEDANALKVEEAAETQKEREQLSVLEAKAREEAAEASAKRTEAKAAARAKRREEAAERTAALREAAAEANARQRESAAKSTPHQTTTLQKKKTTPVKQAPEESVTAPPTVTVPSGSG